jgi:hypothetical protein
VTDNVAGSTQWQWSYAEILAAYLQREFPIFRKYSEGELLALALDMVTERFLPPEREIREWIDALQQADRELLTDRIVQALKKRRRHRQPN